MLATIDFRSGLPLKTELLQALPRADFDVEAAVEQVQPILDAVRHGDVETLKDFGEKFDGIRPTQIKVPNSELNQALQNLDPQIRAALEISIRNNRLGHEAQLPADKTTEIISGGTVNQRWVPVQRVGLYVPGGLAVYPSSVVMNAVCAQVAGVKKIAVATPPQKNNQGLPNQTILAACALLGIEEVYAVGGAQAIAMFAYGIKEKSTDSLETVVCEPVDVITGPGNIYVATAKRLVKSVCGIDAEAGPTEIAIVADESANPKFVAADMISQAEHDPQAASVLITSSLKLATAVEVEITKQVVQTRHQERVKAALAGKQSAIVLVKNTAEALAVANAYGAEHLEIQTINAAEDAQMIYNAGAVFVGDYSPVPLGDYLAGSNHVLPTGGTARFSSGLSVMTYLKSMQEITYSKDALATLAYPLTALAKAEDLPAHADAVNLRFPNQNRD